MTVSIIIAYHTSAKIFRYIKHEIKKCHTRNTVLRYVCDMYCYVCNTTNIITECNLVTNISQEGTIIVTVHVSEVQYDPKGQWHYRYFIEILGHIPWKRCRRRYWWACKVKNIIVRWKVMGINDDVIVPRMLPPLWYSNANHNSAARVAS